MKKEKKSLIYRFGVYITPKIYRWKYKCTVQGKENIPLEGPVVIASSHVTNYDPIILGDLANGRKLHYMAKDSLFKNKIIGWLLRELGAFPVVRGSGGEDALNEARNILNDEFLLCVFIEGTRSKDGSLGKPKTGASLLAYEGKATVVPVAIIGEGGQKPQKKIECMVNIGKPIPYTELGMDDSTSMHCRRGAKKIMSEISLLRDEAIEILDKRKKK